MAAFTILPHGRGRPGQAEDMHRPQLHTRAALDRSCEPPPGLKPNPSRDIKLGADRPSVGVQDNLVVEQLIFGNAKIADKRACRSGPRWFLHHLPRL
jgi:hypothetical protein